jgi:RNA polymerase primary sigma factor
MVRLYRSGTAVQEIARRFNRAPSSVYRALHRALMEKVLSFPVRYVPNPVFAAANAEQICLGDEKLFTYPPEPPPDMPPLPEGVPPYLAELYSIPLLSREREAELFRKYNYVKYLAAMLQERIRRTGYRTGMLERFEELREAAAQIRRILIRCNLRLVVSIAKRHTGPLASLSDLTSEGNLCLIRAVESYDFSRSARFATYATWALTKHFARVVPEENYRLSAFVTGQQARLDAAGDARESASERTELAEHIRALLERAIGHLTARERVIVESRYGTRGEPAKTLEEIGQLIGLTRERVRQIEARALEKLRAAIGPEAIEGVT